MNLSLAVVSEYSWGIVGLVALAVASVLAISGMHTRRAAKLLARERNLLRSLIDNLPDHIYIKDVAGRYILDNIAHARFVGAKNPGEIIGKTAHDFFSPEAAQRYIDDDHEVIESGQPMMAREEMIASTAGQARWLSTTKVPLRDSDGTLLGLVCISRDITVRRQVEQERRDLQKFLGSIIENIPDMIFVKDGHDLRFLQFNKAGEDLLGIPREAMIGKNDYDFFPREEADFFTTKDRSVLESGKLLEIQAEEIKTTRGIRVLHTKKIPLMDDHGKPRYLLGISEDVTERRQAEQQLHEKNHLLEDAVRSERQAYDALKNAQARMVEAEKLAALGQLVAGVAHEINNPLAFVSNNVAILQRYFVPLSELLHLYRQTDEILRTAAAESQQKIADLVERMDLDYTMKNVPELLSRSREGLKRIQEIVKDLRDFSRQEAIGEWHEGVDINSGIESTINIARGRGKRNNVELVKDLSPLPGIICQPDKLNQVLLNLLVNAIDACEHGGKVTVSTRPIDNGVEILVSDTGCGIPMDIRGKIFDPFFTTKPQGRGTGLGLSISHGIITDHGGTIEVDSTPGQGARFKIHLPLIPPAAMKSPAPSAV